MIYLTVFGASLLLYLLTEDSLTFRKIGYFGYLLFLFVFTAYRLEVGCDYYSYLNQQVAFEQGEFSDAISRQEPLYWLLVVALNKLGLAFPVINVVSAAIFFAGVHILARKQKIPLLFLVLIYPILVTNLAMSAIRQAMAVGVLCLAFASVQDKKFTRYVICVIVASGFHQSAIVFLPLVFLFFDFNVRLKFFSALFLFIPSLYIVANIDANQRYLDLYVDTGIDAIGGIFRASSLGITALIFLYFYRNAWRQVYPKEYLLLFYSALLMIFTVPLTLYSSVIGDRFGYYLMLPQAMMFNRYKTFFRSWEGTIHFLAPILMLGVMLIVWVTQSDIFESCYGTYNFWVPFTGFEG